MNSFFCMQATVNTQWTTLALVIGWMLTIFVGLLGGIILWLIIRGRINLSQLISEPSGQASLSRFQFLIFTFVIALSLFLIIVAGDKPMFPATIPGGILALLGISGGSYVISKGIQSTKEVGIMDAVYGNGSGDGGGGAGAAGVAAAIVVPPVPPVPEVKP
jgi:uncharacterized BrkB/YihY/UPF0761 family membrane protein